MGRKRSKSLFVSNENVPTTDSVQLREKNEEHYKLFSKSLQDTSERTLDKCDACGQVHYFHNVNEPVNENATDNLLNITHEIPVASLLYRSRSLPQLSFHDSGMGSGNEQTHGRPTSRLASDLRQLLTLKQHYYPEGGWGWIIVIVGVIVQVLAHGLHGAVGILLQQINKKFGSQIYFQTVS